MQIIKKLALALFGVCLVFGAGELVMRYGSFGPDVFSLQRGMIRLSEDPLLRYELVPDYVSPRRDVIINRHGMRYPPVEMAKPENGFRIAVIGDSIAFGMGTGQEDHLALALMREFAERTSAPRIEVLNFGVPGYNIEQVAASLPAKAAAFDPDLVLYLYCLNDPQEFSRELEVLLRRNQVSQAQRDYLQRVWQRSHTLLGGSKLWSLIRFRIASLTASSEPDLTPIIDDMDRILQGDGETYYHALYQNAAALRRLEKGLDALATWNQEQQIPVILVTVPLFIDLNTYAFPTLHQQVASMASYRDLLAWDVLPAFQELGQGAWKDFHADPLHPNREGYALIARKITDWLERSALSPTHLPVPKDFRE